MEHLDNFILSSSSFVWVGEISAYMKIQEIYWDMCLTLVPQG